MNCKFFLLVVDFVQYFLKMDSDTEKLCMEEIDHLVLDQNKKVCIAASISITVLRHRILPQVLNVNFHVITDHPCLHL